ncbi:hypothetical protein D3C85_1340620 [compost metagenome]
MRESARYPANHPALLHAAAVPDIPGTAADDPAARGYLIASRALRTAPSGQPSPDRDRGTRRERVRTAVKRLHGPGQTAGYKPTVHPVDPERVNHAGKCLTLAHLLYPDFQMTRVHRRVPADAATGQRQGTPADAKQ